MKEEEVKIVFYFELIYHDYSNEFYAVIDTKNENVCVPLNLSDIGGIMNIVRNAFDRSEKQLRRIVESDFDTD